MLRLAGANLFKREPVRGQNSGIKRTLCIMGNDVPAKGEAQIAQVALRMTPVIDADQTLRDKAVGRLFQRLAHRRLTQRFTAFKMTGRLIKTYAVFGFFFNQ